MRSSTITSNLSNVNFGDDLIFQVKNNPNIMHIIVSESTIVSIHNDGATKFNTPYFIFIVNI
ncbi:hypothetical protein okayama9524_20020 [Yersinia pseudotuberculosis]|uniref:Uncharacterized protein n=1 Tax=Yersinia wautersii TaxID=1341643 RepID=A0ABP1ZCC5_9GAMM|nr:Uncharacterised protein [Yersinia wautersii]